MRILRPGDRASVVECVSFPALSSCVNPPGRCLWALHTDRHAQTLGSMQPARGCVDTMCVYPGEVPT